MTNIYFSSPLSGSLYLEKLPIAIQQRIAKRKQKQNLSITGYYMLQQALEKDFNADLQDLIFLSSGKPVLRGQEIYFSISHSKNLVGIAISRVGEIGLDIEPFRKFEHIDAAFSFFSKVEQDFIEAHAQPNHNLIALWSKKEALIKAIGSQMFDDASKTDVRFSTTTHKGQNFFFKSISPNSQYNFDGEIWLAASYMMEEVIIQDFSEKLP